MRRTVLLFLLRIWLMSRRFFFDSVYTERKMLLITLPLWKWSIAAPRETNVKCNSQLLLRNMLNFRATWLFHAAKRISFNHLLVTVRTLMRHSYAYIQIATAMLLIASKSPFNAGCMTSKPLSHALCSIVEDKRSYINT